MRYIFSYESVVVRFFFINTLALYVELKTISIAVKQTNIPCCTIHIMHIINLFYRCIRLYCIVLKQ